MNSQGRRKSSRIQQLKATGTTGIHDLFTQLRISSGSDYPYNALLGKIRDESVLSPYVKNLLSYVLSILSQELHNRKETNCELFASWGVWRNLGMVDQLEIPNDAVEYIQHMFPIDQQCSDEAESAAERALWMDAFRDHVALSYMRDHKPGSESRSVIQQKLVFVEQHDSKGTSWWVRARPYEDKEAMEAERKAGIQKMEKHISNRLKEGEDIRSLTRRDLEEIDAALPSILNALRDARGDFMTVSIAYFLHGIWKLAYDTYGALEESKIFSLDERQQLWISAAIKHGLRNRYYAERIRLGEEEAQLHRFITTFGTTGEFREVLCGTNESPVRTAKRRREDRSDNNGAKRPHLRASSSATRPIEPSAEKRHDPTISAHEMSITQVQSKSVLNSADDSTSKDDEGPITEQEREAIFCNATVFLHQISVLYVQSKDADLEQRGHVHEVTSEIRAITEGDRLTNVRRERVLVECIVNTDKGDVDRVRLASQVANAFNDLTWLDSVQHELDDVDLVNLRDLVDRMKKMLTSGKSSI